MALSILKSTLLAAGLALGSFTASAQTFPEVIANPDIPLTWLGLDFSGVKYFGDPMTVSPAEMKGLFTKMNELIVNEPAKYDLGKAFHRTKVTYNYSVAEAVNAKIDPATLVSADFNQRNRFNVEKINGVVSNYAFPAGSTGVGLVFVMEDLVKPGEQTVFWVTFVDMASKKMLYTEKIAGTAMGFGFRNHWAGGIYDALKTIKSRKYGEWKKKFVPKGK